MPAVLKDALERAYQSAGWELDRSECRYQRAEGKLVYPNFTDVLKQIHQVIDESQYSAENKGDYKGALCTRIKSLT
ncbi:MAG: ATP-binding protein, partial [Lachnospiraceae bacterium]|nr:ATP-binding protein [Lachnospiraceae bacterium]